MGIGRYVAALRNQRGHTGHSRLGGLKPDVPEPRGTAGCRPLESSERRGDQQPSAEHDQDASTRITEETRGSKNVLKPGVPDNDLRLFCPRESRSRSCFPSDAMV